MSLPPQTRLDRPPARMIWPPEPGYFRVRLARKAWAVPARIVREAGVWHAIIDEYSHLSHSEPDRAPAVAWLWTSGVAIDAAQYQALCVLKAWARVQAPAHPCLSPYSPIDPAKLTPIDPSIRRALIGASDFPRFTQGDSTTA